MRPCRVLHLIDTGGPGGAETIFLKLVTGLDRARWESVAVVPEKDWLFDALRQHGIEPLVVPMHRSFDVGYARMLYQLIRTQNVSIVQAHLLTSAVYGSIAAGLARVPAVCTFHGISDMPAHERFRSAKIRAFDRRMNRVVFVSNSLRRAFRDTMPLRRAASHVVWNGHDACALREARDEEVRNELGIRPHEILVGAIGNIREPKAYHVLLRAAALLVADDARFRVVIVGDTRSPLYDELLALRHQLGLDEVVRFTGFRTDVARILRGLDVFALSSSAEGFSLATVQALATGVPVVCTRCGGPEDILKHDVTGQLVPCNEPAAMAAAIRRAVADEVFAHRTTRAGHVVSAAFSNKSMIHGYETIYEESLPWPAYS